MLPAHIPTEPGPYVLWLWLSKSRSIGVGKLGKLDFSKGWYAYVGSAMGPGGVAARVGRHYKLKKKKHWHIDYLRPATRVEGLFWRTDPLGREHIWAQRLGVVPLAGQPVYGFGATDCRCISHLFYYPRCPDLLAAASTLKACWVPLAARR